ncbi:hypothetical protein CFN78_06925 [Amycolatopsis antarctica]|uniref:Transcriptional regulator WhiB n=1 Tax=Amycolatopsis antarctica TaxID=1854586 RepID=A0A263D682_9PSEU|nr:hypothetical protein CFN78_06925 [Amycolatopsis antarctica]
MRPLELPQPPAWMTGALCAQTDPEEFYPEKGGSTAAAKRICQACDVRVVCLAYALDRGERHGIWGGVSERDRRAMTAEQRRNHPNSRPNTRAGQPADPLVDAEIMRLTHAGHSARAIATELGITHRRVQRARARNRPAQEVAA